MKNKGKAWRAVFISALAEHGIAAYAAKAAGVAIQTAYDARERDAVFAEAWKTALATSEHVLEMELRRRAVLGVEKPVFYMGKKCGTVTQYSDLLLMFYLKARNPAKYRDSLAPLTIAHSPPPAETEVVIRFDTESKAAASEGAA